MNITDLTYSFIDYLTFILHDTVGYNETELEDNFDISTFPPTTDISTTDYSTTNFPSTYFSSVEQFKSAVVPLISKTIPTTEFVDSGRLDYDLNSLYGEITSTVTDRKSVV